MIALNIPYLPDFSRYQRYLQSMYQSKWLTNNGPMVRELTERLEEHLGVNNLLLVANGTTALQLCYKALSIEQQAITTPFTFIATANSLDWQGISPVFSDINRESFNLCPTQAVKALNASTNAVVPVHVYGNPCDVAAFEQLGKERDVKVIYDAAQAFGVKVGEQSVLSYGNASVLSFHATKLFHTTEGGAAIFNSNDDYERASAMINFGIDQQTGEIISAGTNAKMSEAHAAMGLAVLDDIAFISECRLNHYALYKHLLGHQVSYPMWHPNSAQNGAYMPIVLASAAQCSAVYNALAKNNIESRRYFSPALNDIAHLSGNNSACDISTDIAGRVLCLPLYVALRPAQIHKICQVVLRALN